MEKEEFKVLDEVSKKLTHVGVITASLTHLEKLLGPATSVTDADLITKRWIIKWPDSSIADIFDWESEKHESADPDQEIVWHVAGTTQLAYTHLMNYLEK